MRFFSVDIPGTDGICDSYIAYPEENGSYTGVILYMDAFGLRPYLQEMAKELAALGYFVFAPNLFYRQRRSPVIDMEFPISAEAAPAAHKQLRALIEKHSPALTVKDAKMFFDFLSRQKQCAPGGYGLTGYCMGGGMAIRTAAEYPDQIRAVASFHAGRLATDAPDSPHLLFPKIKAELYIAHADRDETMPTEQIERVRKALEQSPVKYKAEVYEGALHGYTMMDLPNGNVEALKRHWTQLSSFFARTLKHS